ncbi:MAG TPA: ribonuclease HI family protein [Bacillota bacterium]|nr:ribonuclease HI family protein [Bacillota bacterium]
MSDNYMSEPLIEVTIYTDGASRGNPGSAGIGAVILDADGSCLMELCEWIGIATNNEAEYIALIKALEAAKALGARRVRVYADSELVVRQLKGEYAVKSPRLRPLFMEARRLKDEFDKFSICHIKREKNARADVLANIGIDSGSDKPGKPDSDTNLTSEENR